MSNGSKAELSYDLKGKREEKERQNETVTVTVLDEKLGAFLEHMQQIYAQSENNILAYVGEKVTLLEKKVTTLQEQNEDLGRKVEYLERQQKRRNITISKLNVRKEKVQQVLKEAAEAAGAEDINIKDVREIKLPNGETKFVGELGSFEEKLKLMRAKKQLIHDGEKFFINDDLTKNERDMQYKARRFAEAATGNTRVAYGKVFVNGAEYKYNAKEDKFTPTHPGSKETQQPA